MKFLVKHTVLATTAALILAGAGTSASAYDRYDGNNDGYYDNGSYSSADRYDNTYDSRYDNRYDSSDRYDNRYDNGYDNRTTTRSWDLDCDGVNDRYDRNIRNSNDSDCDGVANRYDHSYDRSYDQRYISNSRHSHRWAVGSRLPSNYYGSSYYIDYAPYGLSRPSYGYRWNRVGNDVYLVSTRNGMIVRVEYNVFR